MCAKQTNWYLRKPDGSEYGPVTTSELLRWATQSRIVAGNGVSADRETWQKVEDIPELEMDWLAQRPDGREYGPFNIAATRELFEHDVLPADAVLTHRTTHKSATVETVLNEEGLSAEDETPDPPAEEPAPKQKRAAKPKAAKAETDEVVEDIPEAAEEPADPIEEAPTTPAEEEVEEEEDVPPEPAPEETSDETPEETTEETPEETEDPPVGSSPELDELKTKIDKLETKLNKARADLRQTRKDLASEQAKAEETATDLVAERDKVQKALTAAQDEAKALTADMATAQAALDEANSARKQAESTLARLESERGEAEEQALQSTAELRKQTAFMKKNIGTLQGELEAMRVKAASRGRALAVILTLLALAGGIFLLTGLPGCEDRPVREEKGQPAETGGRDEAEPSRQPPSDAPPRSSSDSTPPASSRRNPVTPTLAPWPTIMIEGVKVRAEAHVCTVKFDSGVFTRMPTPSEAAIRQLKAIADTIRPKLASFHLIVEGHTDDQPLKPTASYSGNYALGLARAETIRKLLITEGKLPGGAIRSVSAGEGKAPYPNDSAANRKRNRTVVLKLVRK